MSRAFLIRDGTADRRHDAVIPGAAAYIAGHRFADFGFSWLDGTLYKRRHRHDETRSAIAALQAMLFDKGFLQRMQFTVLGHPFDRNDLHAVALRSECQAGEPRLAASL